MDASLQQAAPLLNALQALAQRSRAAFHTPGHKQGWGAPLALRDAWGWQVFRADLPELPELDNLFAPEGVIESAQILAADAFGAEQTWFLANGSTCGIEAAVLATCNPGDKLILPRNVHQSAVAALILSGAVPIWIAPEYDDDWNLAHGISPARLETVLAQHPDAKAVLIVSPTYYGVCSETAAIAQVTHYHQIPLLVDEAHGAHFAFHPDLPTSALESGADLVVQSTHKTLSALTQAAMLHVRGARIDRDRLSRCLQLVQSTSPNYLLLASLDGARHQMATQGQALLDRAIALATSAQACLSQIPGLAVLKAQPTVGFAALDPTRLTVDVRGIGLTGFAADELLHQQKDVTCELPGLSHLTFIITPGNTSADIDRLIQGIQSIASDSLPLAPLKVDLPGVAAEPASAVMTPRQAFYAPSRMVPVEQAIGQVSAELICPYPPGIPVLLPGEIIRAEAIAYLQHLCSLGSVITGCTDPNLQRLKII